MHARNIAIVLAAVLSQISALAQRLPPDLSSEEQEEIDTQGRLLLSSLEPYQHGESEIVFLVDSSGSIGASNFHFEINFIREISTIFSMSPDEARVSVVTYSDSSKIVRQIDYIGSSVGKNKCTFLGELSLIRYEAGWTDTKGALEEADRVLQHARSGANRLVVLLTDGQSTEGDPVGIATRIRNKGIRIVAIGVGNVNMDELTSIATAQYVFILDRLSYVVDLATRIKNDVKEKSWDMSVLESSCNYLCTDGNDCCDDKARCSCGTSSGTHQCACQAGYSGNGLNGQCTACPRGTYKQMVGNLDCVACPDNSNTEDTGSVSIDQCRCNAGYIERPDHSCSIVTCARLTAPPGGYIMPNPCANTFGSSCEFKCSSNYRPMPGGSHRIECLENGQWSGQPFICRKITCEALSEPSNGNLLCDTDDNSIDTWCTFTCNHGYDILGSEDTRCVLEEGGNERWTDAEPKCKIRSCQPLEVKKNMRLRPSACEETNIPYMEVCVYSCKDGYMLHGAETSECQADGEWSNVNVERFCKDNEPSKFLNCPSDVTVTAELHMSKGKLTWEEPTATDNSGIAPSITMIPNIQGPPFWFPIGESTVTYIAMDGEHLVDECRFIVTVIDEESPSVLTCPGDIEIQSASRSSNVTWIEPTFQDNSGEDVTVYMNRQPGSTFYWGSSSVTYEAVDWTGNTALCKFEVNLKQHNCEHASPPENGSLSCENWLGGQFCMVSCQVKYDFVFDPEDIYYCKQNRITHKGEWAPAPIVSRGDRDFKFPWPDCARMTEPSKLSLGLAVQYYVDNCFGETGKEEIRRNFITKFQQLEQQASGFCLDERCAVENIAVYCGPSSSTSSVHKRDVSRNVIRVSYTLIVETQPDSPDSTDTDGGSEESTADGQPALRPIDMLRQLKNEVQVTASRGLFRAIITNTGINTVPSDEPELIEESNVVVECPVGHIWRNDSCLTCPIGTYHDVTTNTCTACAIGMYQDTEASTYCQQCPPNTLTTKTRSKTISACVGFCQPGTFSKTGLETCILCPRGSYQPNNGSTSCISCEENLSTWTDGAVSADYCKVGCISGSYSETGFMPCIPCQRGTYQPRGSQKSCIPCEDGKTTHFQGAHAIQYCQVIDLCELFPCQHNATCVSMNETRQCQCIPGYGGESCEINIDDCEEDLCKNNGTCVDGVDDYHCICQIGFTGANCQINIDECKSSPCLNGASCYDRSSGYMCKCLDGYTGAQCEINYFDCASSPCKNGGTCFDLAQNFTCCCPPGYAGRFCEEEVNECQSSPCQNGGLCISGLGNYTCECLSGFIGEDCDVNIDECASYPCSNGGTCIDLIDSYFCECDISYLGDNCETFISTDFNLLFTSSQATDYASIDRVSDMYECTISFWMKTSDSSSYGTPISYAQSSDGAVTDNALTLQDYNNFVLYINDDPVYTNLKANGDSDWHHVAVTWESDTGSWAVYFDNVYVRGGVSFQQAAVIRGGGILVIGQDQDSVGGQFNAAECFVGELSQVNIWNFAMTPIEVSSLYAGCDNQGNVVAWIQMKHNIHGNVVVEENSTLCAGKSNCEGNTCFNGGTCIDLIDDFSCECATGYTGEHCQEYLESCQHRLCSNGGTCLMEGLNNTCICKQGFSGVHCELNHECSENPCRNGGSCEMLKENPVCTCDNGFTGRQCQYDIDECRHSNGGCSHQCHNTNGSFYCTCPDGFALTTDGKTCMDTSYCSSRGVLYSAEEVWTENCQDCQCENGLAVCQRKYCPPLSCPEGQHPYHGPDKCCSSCVEDSKTCVVSVTGQYSTFDWYAFQFRGRCRYVLAQDCSSGDFSIQIEEENGSVGRSISHRKALFIHISCVNIVIHLDGRVTVAEREVNLPYVHASPKVVEIIKTSSNSTFVKTSYGVTIDWDMYGDVVVFAPRKYTNKLCGLCGNMNSESGDDKITRQYLPARTVNEFIHSFKVDGYKHCRNPHSSRSLFRGVRFTNVDVCAGKTYREQREARARCSALRKPAFHPCYDVVNPKSYYQMCLEEVCSCAQNELCYCEAVVAYVHECRRNGIIIRKWKDKELCGSSCPPDMIYDHCGPPCPETCEGLEEHDPLCHNQPCVPKCQCPAGYVLHEEACIPRSKCPSNTMLLV